MSRWKDVRIKIVQIVPKISAGYHASYSDIDHTIGLGDDSMLYEWDVEAGKWLKGWDISNE